MYLSRAWIHPLIVFVITFAVGYLIRHIVFTYIKKLTEKTTTRIDDIILEGIRAPFIFWIKLAGIYFSLKTIWITSELRIILDKTIAVIVIVSFTYVIARVVVNIIKTYAGKIESAELPVPSLTENVATICIGLTGFLIVLNLLGISITPILTALGVGGLAVALALQDTLANFFSGLYIILSKQVRVGDYIEMESGQKGYVKDISWRTSRIQELPNNIVIIPNVKLSQAIVRNYNMPQKDLSVAVPVGVSYDSDLEKVEKVTIEVAREVMKTVKGGVPDYEPSIGYNAFADSSINFNVIMRAREFTDQYTIIHEFIKRLKKRYDQEGINIPYPVRTIYMQNKNQ